MQKRKLTKISVAIVAIAIIIYGLFEIPLLTSSNANFLSITPKDKAFADAFDPEYTSSDITGNFTFTQSNCVWLVCWTTTVPSTKGLDTGLSRLNLFIYKISEHTAFLGGESGIALSTNVQIQNDFETPFYPTEMNNPSFGHSPEVGAKYVYYLTDLWFHGDNDTSLIFTCLFYERNVIGIFPQGEHTISVQPFSGFAFNYTFRDTYQSIDS
jgi:hypothetical protein